MTTAAWVYRAIMGPGVDPWVVSQEGGEPAIAGFVEESIRTPFGDAGQ
ncbi:MAG: hypothetical protein R2709_00075 [Marmoricola sp.]